MYTLVCFKQAFHFSVFAAKPTCDTGDQYHSALVWDLQEESVQFGKLTEQETSSCIRPKTQKTRRDFYTVLYKHKYEQIYAGLQQCTCLQDNTQPALSQRHQQVSKVAKNLRRSTHETLGRKHTKV